jgi:hypothetical protein
VSYAVRAASAVVGSLSRLEIVDPVGAHLVHGAIQGLAKPSS